MVKKSASATDEVHWLNLRYTETQCPGLHQALESAPNDQLSALARGIIYQWFLHHQQAGTLTKAVVATLAGPGATGQRSLRRSSRPRKTLAPGTGGASAAKRSRAPMEGVPPTSESQNSMPVGFAGSTEAPPPPVREISRLSSPPASAPALPQISMEQPSTMGKIPATIKMNRWTKPRTRCSRSSIK
jgi:hypothetical protein